MHLKAGEGGEKSQISKVTHLQPKQGAERHQSTRCWVGWYFSVGLWLQGTPFTLYSHLSIVFSVWNIDEGSLETGLNLTQATSLNKSFNKLKTLHLTVNHKEVFYSSIFSIETVYKTKKTMSGIGDDNAHKSL